MTKRAFLFAGQGAQKLGMASDLYAAYPVVKETFDTASRILGYDLRELIDSNEEKLNQTRYTQPAILTTSVAIYRLLAENGITPDIVAGLSLGEYSALVAAGALSFEDAVALVAKRGEFMEDGSSRWKWENGCCYEYRSKFDRGDLSTSIRKGCSNTS